MEEAVLGVLMHITDAGYFIRSQPNVIICAKFFRYFLAQEAAYRFTGDSSQNFSKQIANVD